MCSVVSLTYKYKSVNMLKIRYGLVKTLNFKYCTNNKGKSNTYGHTVLLPKTKLPLRLEGKRLIERDKNIHNTTGFDDLYSWQRKHLSGAEFVLHDGPPYANGKLHMGHAINKILKDTILRYKVLQGTKVHYVPGWDCHGLPIELKALSGLDNLNPVEIREKARNFAKTTVEEQKSVFKSWGILGDWDNAYTTYSVDYVANQFRQFFKLYEKGLVYRAIKPIHWSPSSGTALAEAELEYNDSHKSPSAYVRLEVKDIPKVPNFHGKRVYAVVWTTTPWTLPSNQAVCYNSGLSYCVVKKPDPFDTDLYIIATDLLESFCKETNCNFLLLGVHSGDMLAGASYVHPVYKEKVCNFYHSSHATATKGTGLVHTSPAHGPDDFLIALSNKIPIIDLVDDDGCFKKEAGKEFEGKFVLSEGNEAVVRAIREDLIHLSQLRHSYPYDWRTKKPIIIKASKQWFVDTESVKRRALELLEKVEIAPQDKSEAYKKTLTSELQKRPYWCISRQRKWGVPIPVFYHRKSENVIINESTISHICDLLHKNGTDFWWTLKVDQLLPDDIKREFDTTEIDRGQDILDIWFDSGVSWSKVLADDQVADLYLEGVDQFNGWFQSSLVTSVGLRDRAPYKALLVHGFAVDKNGNKMSKSLGNVVDPVVVQSGGSKPYGIDTMRWWVACHANQVALAQISDNVLDRSKEELQKIRSVLRFALGALYDYHYDEKDFEHLWFTDRYMMHVLYQFHQKCQKDIESYNFNKINTSLLHLLTNPVSALYYTAIKDRLYCEPSTSLERRSVQYTLIHIFYTVASSIAGIVPHLAEELYSYLPQKGGGTFFTDQRLQARSCWEDLEVARAMELLLDVRKEINRECGAATLDRAVSLQLSGDDYRLLTGCGSVEQLQRELVDVFQISEVGLSENFDLTGRFRLEIGASGKFGCPRCRRVKSSVENDPCQRCRNVVHMLDVNKTVLVN
ncbi:isoleucine--tRNA ligase, mitochondrial [Cylas formicarius]|uniref:isoleucine--tRNA ligase, mitochondrial n=1 Tax=Cylas formicarius TaxID=197179 RepID=UPI002958B09C|nr:isoleucine--tRNA ligase, mitochondrial [Cylas formicarius]